MNSLRHLLLVVVLLFAQLASGAHAIEHVVSQEDGLPQHVCELCLVAHDLGAALPSMASLPLASVPGVAPACPTANDRAALPAPLAHQRGPPQS